MQRSTANHRVQAMGAFNADRSNSGAELQVIANVNRRASIIAEMRRTATIAADMIADKMARIGKEKRNQDPCRHSAISPQGNCIYLAVYQFKMKVV